MPDAKSVTQQTTALSEPNTVRSPGFQSFYVNNTKFSTSAFEFSMTFGEIGQDEHGKFVVEEKVRLVMSPLHAKIFAALISQNVKSFEARMGEIKTPPGAVAIETAPVDVEVVTPTGVGVESQAEHKPRNTSTAKRK